MQRLFSGKNLFTILLNADTLVIQFLTILFRSYRFILLLVSAPLIDTHSRELACFILDSFRVGILFLEFCNLLDLAIAILYWVRNVGNRISGLFY